MTQEIVSARWTDAKMIGGRDCHNSSDLHFAFVVHTNTIIQYKYKRHSRAIFQVGMPQLGGVQGDEKTFRGNVGQKVF